MRLTLFCLVLLLIFSAIINAEKPPDMHTSRISLDWQGTYLGILPTAGGGGMETKITLSEDCSYTMQTKYLDKEDSVSARKGKFVWDEKGSKITLQNIISSPSQYLVGENMLIQLDMDGNRITGELEEHYILRKIE
jgi:uncharacterized lipoprotein NlpE involved in copper resistance